MRKPPNIVVLDADPRSANAVRAALSQVKGRWHVRTVACGRRFLEELWVPPLPDVLFCGFGGTSLSAPEVSRHLRQSANDRLRFLPIIVLAEAPHWRHVVEAADAGINEFLVKPLTARAILGKLLAVWERPRPFVACDSYFGPDRRRRHAETYCGPERRSRRPPLIHPSASSALTAPPPHGGGDEW